jgi:hypothetical protein
MEEKTRILIIDKINQLIKEQKKEIREIEEYILELEIDLAAFEDDFETALELTKNLYQYKLLTQ